VQAKLIIYNDLQSAYGLISFLGSLGGAWLSHVFSDDELCLWNTPNETVLRT